MVFSSPCRAKHLVAGAFWVLLAVGGVAPSPARAGCGHDVTSNVSRSNAKLVSNLELFRASALDLNHSSPVGPRRNLPCSGPSCSEGQGLPHAPATSLPLRSDPWCCTTLAIQWRAPQSANRLAKPCTAHPRYSASPIERPPRTPRPRTLS
jgi:hypothetical protein